MPSSYFTGKHVGSHALVKSPAATFHEFIQQFVLRPARLSITGAEYHAMPKAERAKAKLVGYVVAATFPRSPWEGRKIEYARACDLIILDIDDANDARRFVQEPSLLIEALGKFNFAAYQTISSTPASPRIRVIVEASSIPVERYPDAALTVGQLLGLPKVTRESAVAVQPQFRPTVFADQCVELEHPLLVTHFGGRSFAEEDISTDVDSLPGIVSGSKPSRGPSSGSIDDFLTFFQFPVEGVDLAQIEEALTFIDADCSRPLWLEIAAALKHQFSAAHDDEAYTLFDTWSATGSKYEDDKDTGTVWKSFQEQAKGRKPVTIRSLLKRAVEGGWKAAAAARAFINGDTKPLTVRTIAGIMSYEPDEHDLILANGYLCKGDRTVWLGQGGLGKTRISIQLACCCVLGGDFLGTPTRGQGLRWLFLQTENGMRRLKYDLEHMKTQYSDTEWSIIEQHIFFHTLEADEDGVILLNEVTHFGRAKELVLRVRADVIVFDPLRDSHSGDLNGDQEMTVATRNLARLAKVGGRTDRALLVLHHALTGKAGAAKATGFDRASFGRNSKVLQGWTRAQVNFAPGSAENSEVLVVASGKNNNFKEFQPFAIELDASTMSYKVKPDFDFDVWQAAIAGKKQDSSIEHETLAILDGSGGRMEKKVLIDKAKEKTGRGVLAIRNTLKVMTTSRLLNEVSEARSGKPAAVFIELCKTNNLDLEAAGY